MKSVSITFIWSISLVFGLHLEAATPPDSNFPDGNDMTVKIIELARTDMPQLLNKAIAYYDQHIHDYTGTLYKQERIRGKLLDEQVIDFKFKENPFSIVMRWEKNAIDADRILYVEDTNNPKVIAHPTGVLFWISSVKSDPASERALKWNLYPISDFGFKRMMKKMLMFYRQGSAKELIEMRAIEPAEFDGRKCVKLDIAGQMDTSIATRSVVYIDSRNVVPILVETYGEKGKLIGRYAFKNLKFNVGLTDKDFLPEKNGF